MPLWVRGPASRLSPGEKQCLTPVEFETHSAPFYVNGFEDASHRVTVQLPALQLSPAEQSLVELLEQELGCAISARRSRVASQDGLAQIVRMVGRCSPSGMRRVALGKGGVPPS